MVMMQNAPQNQKQKKQKSKKKGAVAVGVGSRWSFTVPPLAQLNAQLGIQPRSLFTAASFVYSTCWKTRAAPKAHCMIQHNNSRSSIHIQLQPSTSKRPHPMRRIPGPASNRKADVKKKTPLCP
eukprot:1735479-Rhodomonas_salina.1